MFGITKFEMKVEQRHEVLNLQVHFKYVQIYLEVWQAMIKKCTASLCMT